MAEKKRVLLAMTVYNGWSYVPRSLKSAKGLQTQFADVDVLVLDDASPEPGFSEKLAALCKELEVYYYRSPRNLGIVRNVNLGLLCAVEHQYDYVIISNSDVIYSKQTVDYLVEAAQTDSRIGSVTAWSNNVSIYSIPNSDPETCLASQDVVDWLSASLAGAYRGLAIDVPAGISFCILIPTEVIRAVGLMDPVFGRGYCEETDWSLRSLAMGYRITLAPAAFVYHQGRASTLEAGLVSAAHTTVPENEAVIDYRYPLFRGQVDAFLKGGILHQLHRDGASRIIKDAGSQFGFDIQTEANRNPAAPHERVLVTYGVEGIKYSIRADFLGFSCAIPRTTEKAYDAIVSFFNNRAPFRLAGGLAGKSTLSHPDPARPSYPNYV